MSTTIAYLLKRVEGQKLLQFTHTVRCLLKWMHHTVGAGHLSGNRQGCVKGTRLCVLQRLKDLLRNEPDQRILWLHGDAGTGKSAIAQTFADVCFADGILGANFFCSRGSHGRNNTRYILPTLAFQLAHRYPQFRESLKLLRSNPGVGLESLNSQMDKLIVGPFEATQIQTLVIIDALDECNSRGGYSTRRFLSSLFKYVNGIPHIKFFITGRPEDAIFTLGRGANVVRLQDVERSLVDADIKLCLRAWLRGYGRRAMRYNLSEGPWPRSDRIGELCSLAGGSFVDAARLAHQVCEAVPPS